MSLKEYINFAQKSNKNTQKTKKIIEKQKKTKIFVDKDLWRVRMDKLSSEIVCSDVIDGRNAKHEYLCC